MKTRNFCAYILLYLTIFLNSAGAQPHYFNKLYHYNNTGCIALNSIETNDGFIIAGNTEDTLNPYWLRASFMKINHDGAKIWAKDYGDTIKQWGVNISGSLIRNSDTSYLIAGGRVWYFQNPYVDGLLFCINENGDTLWTKGIRPDQYAPLDTQISCQYITRLADLNYIMTGSMTINNGLSKIALTKFDNFGNTLLTLSGYGYGGNYKTRGCSVKQLKDHGFIIGAYSYQPGHDETLDPVLYKIDSAGNLEWFKGIGGPWMDSYVYLSLASDSTFIAGTTIETGMFGNDHRDRIKFAKFDMNGTQIWSKTYGPEMFESGFYSMVPSNDGGYVACGYMQHNNGVKIVGWVMKISHQGDSLWYREVENLSGYQSMNYLEDIIECSDKGFLACGDVYPSQPDTGITAAWVIKLDSIGCPYPNCDSTNSVAEHQLASSFSVSLWPNPANEFVNIEIFPAIKTKNYILKIYDTYGLCVITKDISSILPAFQIDIKNLKQGLYFAEIKGNGPGIFVGKFLVIR